MAKDGGNIALIPFAGLCNGVGDTPETFAAVAG